MGDMLHRDMHIIHFTMTAFLLEPGEEMILEDVRFEDIWINGEGQCDLAIVQPTVNTSTCARKLPATSAMSRSRTSPAPGNRDRTA